MTYPVRIAAVVALAVALAPPAAAHKYHASLANVELNAQEKTVEVALRLFSDDLEASLTRRAGKRVTIGLTPDLEARAFAYLSSAFSIQDASGRRLELEWVGMETKVDVVWIYVQAAAPSGLDGATIANELFFDLFEDQVNLVVVKAGNRKASLALKPGSSSATVALE